MNVRSSVLPIRCPSSASGDGVVRLAEMVVAVGGGGDFSHSASVPPEARARPLGVDPRVRAAGPLRRSGPGRGRGGRLDVLRQWGEKVGPPLRRGGATCFWRGSGRATPATVNPRSSSRGRDRGRSG